MITLVAVQRCKDNFEFLMLDFELTANRAIGLINLLDVPAFLAENSKLKIQHSKLLFGSLR